MNKEELKNICSRWLWKAFETGTKQDPFSADNSEYWHPAIDLKWSKDMAEAIDDYAQQVSQKRDIQWMRHLLKWGDKPAKLCPVLPKNVKKESDGFGADRIGNSRLRLKNNGG